MRSFIQYINEETVKPISEASVGRFYSHFMDKNLVMAVISGSRGVNSKEQNTKNTEAIKQELVDNDFSYNKTCGGYIETELDGKNEIKKYIDDEKSIVVYANVANEERLYNLVFRLSKRYQQECFLFIDSEKNVKYVYTNPGVLGGGVDGADVYIPEGAVVYLGEFRANNVKNVFTKIGNKRFRFDDWVMIEFPDGTTLYKEEVERENKRLAKQRKQEKSLRASHKYQGSDKKYKNDLGYRKHKSEEFE